MTAKARTAESAESAVEAAERAAAEAAKAAEALMVAIARKTLGRLADMSSTEAALGSAEAAA